MTHWQTGGQQLPAAQPSTETQKHNSNDIFYGLSLQKPSIDLTYNPQTDVMLQKKAYCRNCMTQQHFKKSFFSGHKLFCPLKISCSIRSFRGICTFHFADALKMKRGPVANNLAGNHRNVIFCINLADLVTFSPQSSMN